MPSQRGGNVGETTQPEQANRQIAQRGKDLGTRSRTDLRKILGEGYVPHPKQGVFDLPMVSCQLEKLFAIGLLRGETGDAVSYLARFVFPLQIGGESFNPKYLPHVRKLQVIIQLGANSNGAGFDATMSLVLFSVFRGKNRPFAAS